MIGPSSDSKFAGRRAGRRRVLGIVAAAAGLPLLPRGLLGANEEAPVTYTWKGRALGAPARLTLVHPERSVAEGAIALCLDEVMRLERVFSLYDPGSELTRLNRDGRLDVASHDLRMLLAESRRLTVASGGAFDVTVQPLWRAHADHFARPGADPAGPDPRSVDAARALVGAAGIDLSGTGVRLARPGMALTLNGIAQGFITDRVAGLLRNAGFDRVLVQLGEISALDAPSDDAGWRVRIPDPLLPTRTVTTLDLVNRAVATSSGQATPFETSARHHHILDPATGRSPNRYRGTTVIAGRAALADALSTALYILPPREGARLVQGEPGTRAIVVDADGRSREIRAAPED